MECLLMLAVVVLIVFKCKAFWSKLQVEDECLCSAVALCCYNGVVSSLAGTWYRRWFTICLTK